MVDLKNFASWKGDFLRRLAIEGIEQDIIENQRYNLVGFSKASVIVLLVDINNSYTPYEFLELSNHYRSRSLKIIQLWEDVWLKSSAQVIDRMKAFCGLNTRIHARKTILKRITKPLAQSFLNENHLQGFASSRFKYSLIYQNEMVAVATFSSLRKMKFTEDYHSVELIRFAIKANYSIPGGLSKLLKGFSRLHLPNDIMTYIDRDWGNGTGFEKLGFTIVALMEPQLFSLDESFNRVKAVADSKLNHSSVFNTGSIKMVLKL